MTTTKTWLEFLFLILILLSPSGKLGATEKTLRRVDDPLVVEGRILAPLHGERLDRLSLMVCTDEGFQPVPFQVDEKGPEGEYVFTQGPEASKDPDPLLDANDELVFMAFTTGPRCNAQAWPEGARAGAEITVHDPLDGGQGWLYLFAFEDQPPRLPDDLVSMEISPDRLRVKTPGYIWGNPEGKGFPDELHTLEAGSEMGPDILDRLKARGDIRLLRGLVKFKLKIDDIIYHEPIGWIDGPLRVILCVKAYLKIGFFKYNLPMKLKQLYYPNAIIMPIGFTMEKSAVMHYVSAIADVNFVAFMDYNEHGYGIHTYDAFNPYNPEVVFDGTMSQAEKSLRTTEHREWAVGYRPGVGGVVNRFITPPEWAGITNELYYLEDSSQEDPPEDHPGITGHGYRFNIKLSYLEPGDYIHKLYYYFKLDFAPGDEKMLLDILDHPLEAQAAKMTRGE